MTEIENEGRVYVLKSEIESIIKERIGKVASRATTAEQALEEAQRRLEKAEKAMSSVDILNQQLAEMQTKLQNSEQRFSRYQSISKHGLTDRSASRESGKCTDHNPSTSAGSQDARRGFNPTDGSICRLLCIKSRAIIYRAIFAAISSCSSCKCRSYPCSGLSWFLGASSQRSRVLCSE